MPPSFAERWIALSPYLDLALDQDEAERAAWLAALREQDPALAADLQALLDERGELEREGFLEASLPLPPPSLSGHTLGAYTLVSLLGQGGMGTVWLAERSDGRYAGKAALKLLNVGSVGSAGQERFKREGQILAHLTHPHIARLIDAGLAPTGQPYLVLEHVDGQPIDRYCDERGLGVEQRLRLVLEVLSAVAHAHANLVVHRDIKPSNILVRADGHVKLLDFGIAKLIQDEAGQEPTLLTRDGERALTPEYAAPEQLTGGAITTATDVYALGTLLYVLLAGRHPAGEGLRSAAELLKTVVETEPPRLSTAVARITGEVASRRGTTPDRLRRALRGDLETIVAKALRKQPEERYPSALALADDLRRYLSHEPIAARPPALTYRAARFAQRHRLAVGLSALVALALVGGLAGTAWQARAAARQRDRALAQLERAESINEFTGFLLGQAVPSGRSVPVSELLGRAEQMVARRFSAADPVAVDLLVSIGGIYAIREESENARRVLKQAYDRSRELADPAVRARALCAWARAVSTEDLAAAARLVDEGLALTSDEPAFDGIVAGCLVDKGTIAMDAGAVDPVLEAAARALTRLQGRPAAYTDVRASALQLLAVGRRMKGDTAGADRAFAEALDYLRSIGREDTSDAAVLQHNWAINVALTSPLQALELNRRVIAIFEGSSPDSVPLPSRGNYAVQLNRLARYAAARPVLEGARALARRKGNSQAAGGSSLQMARACRGLGDLACARTALAEAEADLRSSYPEGHRVLADLACEQGLLAAAEGRPEEGARVLSAALKLHEAVPEKHVSHIETLLALAELELALRRPAEAERHARAALGLADGLRGETPHSAWVGLSQLALARVLEAQGAPAPARGLLADAVAHMSSTLGESHPALADARRRLHPPRS